MATQGAWAQKKSNRENQASRELNTDQGTDTPGQMLSQAKENHSTWKQQSVSGDFFFSTKRPKQCVGSKKRAGQLWATRATEPLMSNRLSRGLILQELLMKGLTQPHSRPQNESQAVLPTWLNGVNLPCSGSQRRFARATQGGSMKVRIWALHLNSKDSTDPSGL